MKNKRVIIAGSRRFNLFNTLEECVNSILLDRSDTEIVSGTARGADKLGEQYANKYKIPVTKFPADWETHGRSAGYKRNGQMALYGTMLIAFWDGKSKGTSHMIKIAKAQDMDVYVFDFGGNLIEEYN